jgi:hypothetical protein
VTYPGGLRAWFRFGRLKLRDRILSFTGNLLAELLQFPLIMDCVLQEFVEAILRLEAASEVRELVAQRQELLERLDLVSDGLWGEVLETAELKVHLQPGGVGVRAQLVWNAESQPGIAGFQHLGETGEFDLDESPMPQMGQRFRRHTAEVGQDADDKRELQRSAIRTRLHGDADTML